MATVQKSSYLLQNWQKMYLFAKTSYQPTSILYDEVNKVNTSPYEKYPNENFKYDTEIKANNSNFSTFKHGRNINANNSKYSSYKHDKNFTGKKYSNFPNQHDRSKNSNSIQPYMNENRIYGIHPVQLALKAKKRRFYHFYYNRGQSRNYIDNILMTCANLKIESTKVNNDKIESLLGSHKLHQGVCLIASALPSLIYDDSVKIPFENWVKEKNPRKPFKETEIWLYLDRILDPQNFGAIIRTAYYFGIEHIFTGVKYRCPITNAASKASSGIAEIMTVMQVTNSVSVIKSLKLNGWKVIIATPGKEGCIQIDKYEGSSNIFLILGSEGGGVSQELVDLADATLSISGKNDVIVQSLNVSAATAILLHSITKKLT